jgi:hypothetical protein
MSASSSPPALEASRCLSCGKHIVPPRRRCPYCGGAMQNVAVEGMGDLLSWTTVHVTPEGIPPPRTVALIRLECGAAVLCLVADSRKLDMGMQVEVLFRDGLYRLG